MRSEQEIRTAAEAFAWYFASGRAQRQDRDTYQNIVGTVAAIEWVLGEGDRNPIAGVLKDIAALRRFTRGARQ